MYATVGMFLGPELAGADLPGVGCVLLDAEAMGAGDDGRALGIGAGADLPGVGLDGAADPFTVTIDPIC